MTLNNRNSLFYSWESQVQSESHWAKIKELAGCVPSGGSRGESVPLPFSLLEAACIPWTRIPARRYDILKIGVRNILDLGK